MPLYEYRCRTCEERFELRRPIADANAPASCPNEHDDTVRLLSMFATHTASPSRQPAAVTNGGGGGGCCGGSCGCRH
jgi:putative FmdB family regulatory protein